MTESTIDIQKLDHAAALFGSMDSNIDIIRKRFNVSIVVRDATIKISGEPEEVMLATSTTKKLLELIESGESLSDQSINYAISLVLSGDEKSINDLAKGVVAITAKGKPIKAKTMGQQDYVDSIRKNTIILGVGPAGTGKTYLAVALAARAFKAGDISRIVLTRPAVEAGEKLGFLPGDLQTKVDPYLRPLHDALFEMFGPENYAKHLERGNIEIAPLAYMRGRTLEDSFIILDEAQNTTREQMKMFLTRLGFGSKMVINGDITQIDLPKSVGSGLIEATKVLKDVEDIDVIRLTQNDVVRHQLVQKIVLAYDNYNNDNKERSKQDVDA